MSTGIRKHGRGYEAGVYDKRTKKKIRKILPSLREARAWRVAKIVELQEEGVVANVTASTRTLEEAWGEWIMAAEQGRTRNRSGDRYKPSVLATYRQRHVSPRVG